MKIFWSWQSDRSQNVCKHFVRQALDEAVKHLSETPEINDSKRPIEQEDTADISVDQDTQGEAGMVDISATILKKIEQSAVFVADITTIGMSESGRQMANPNVLIELGYAMKCLPAGRILLIANAAWRFHPEKLPFDIRHRRGPITYKLKRDADAEHRRQVLRELVDDLESALRPMVVGAIQDRSALSSFDAVEPSVDPARWWNKETELYRRPNYEQNSREEVSILAPDEPLIYFRMIPKKKVDPIRESELERLAQHMPLLISRFANGRDAARNAYGAISFADKMMSDGSRRIVGATQIFRNREIWSIDASLTRTEHPEDLKFSRGSPFVSDEILEQWSLKGMREIADIASRQMRIPFPVDVEFGLAPALGYKMTLWGRTLTGPCYLQSIRCRTILKSSDPGDVQASAVELFEGFWESFGTERPKHHNGIPSK
jgi:hypothetical protein